MQVSLLRVELRFGDCRTARHKRRRLIPMLGKLRRHFNVSAAEVGREDEAAEAILAVVSVARHRKEAREVLERVAELLDLYPHAEVVSRRLTDI